jgi:hypothetical protein
VLEQSPGSWRIAVRDRAEGVVAAEGSAVLRAPSEWLE